MLLYYTILYHIIKFLSIIKIILLLYYISFMNATNYKKITLPING